MPRDRDHDVFVSERDERVPVTLTFSFQSETSVSQDRDLDVFVSERDERVSGPRP